jgi:hypothetical protein
MPVSVVSRECALAALGSPSVILIAKSDDNYYVANQIDKATRKRSVWGTDEPIFWAQLRENSRLRKIPLSAILKYSFNCSLFFTSILLLYYAKPP